MKSPGIDAWITYKSWHIELEEHSEFVELQGDGTLRFIPIALTQRTTYPNEANEFIAFLQSDKARTIFSDHGWE
ncbi:MAG: substrate-binding domain-containing protein [Desulfuromonadales bacterium]|nr:substrate-binding domain-containing protein [Desulfuromonadales bacterium]